MKFALLCFFIFSHTFATDPSATGKVKEDFKKEDFKPHMLEHFYPGCPANSICSKPLGSKLDFWEKSLKKNQGKSFLKKYGIPVSLWSQRELKETSNDLILWDSPCSFHRPKEAPVIQYALSFEKKLSNKNSPRKYFREVFVAEKNKIKTYLGPRDSLPSFKSKAGLGYIQDYKGMYYYLIVKQDGSLRFLKKAPNFSPPQSTQCSDELKSSIKQDATFNKVFNGGYCKKIWNTFTKQYETILLGWSC